MDFRWNDWNLEHATKHGVTPEEAEGVVLAARPPFPESGGDDKFRVWGQTIAGRFLQVVYVEDPKGTLYIIHARRLTEEGEASPPTQRPMTKSTPSKPYWEMNTAELAEATKEFDTPSPPGRWRPLTPAERARWERIKRKPGRPKVGQGVEVISLSIERGLLTRADKLAKKLKVSRARLISEGLQRILAEAASRPSPKRPKTAAGTRRTAA